MPPATTPIRTVVDGQRLILEASQRGVDVAGEVQQASTEALLAMVDSQASARRSALAMNRVATVGPLAALPVVAPPTALPAAVARSLLEAQYDVMRTAHDDAVETVRTDLAAAGDYEGSRAKLDALAEQVERVIARQDDQTAAIAGELDRMEELVNTRFDTVEETVGERIRESQDAVVGRVQDVRDDVDDRVGESEEHVDAQVGALEGELESRIRQSQEQVETQLDTVQGDIDDRVDAAHEQLESQVAALERRIAALQDEIETVQDEIRAVQTEGGGEAESEADD